NRVQELKQPVSLHQLAAFKDSTPGFRLATAVAEFAEILRGSVFASEGQLTEVLNLSQSLQSELMPAQQSQLKDLIGLLEQARRLKQPLFTQSTQPVSTPIAEKVSQSQNPQALPDWTDYLFRQLGGKALQ
ncbi:MAG: hypothetical protein CVV27_01740, partial [Candidatus Melainabacteria bacterium HGW-Melainabacteria-1]